MPYTVSLKPQAEKFLAGLRDARLYRRLRESIDGLADNPRPPGCVKLQGGSELYRVRVGDYRILYRPTDWGLWVERIVNRQDLKRAMTTL